MCRPCRVTISLPTSPKHLHYIYPTVCRYVQTLSGHQPYPLGLATLKGFLFSASPELLTGYPEPEPEP